MKYQTENELLAVVRGFENGTIAREDWRHGEHLTVALYYLSHHNFEAALVKMRDGIFNLLRAFEVDFKKEMPYHETLTVLFLNAAMRASMSGPRPSPRNTSCAKPAAIGRPSVSDTKRLLAR